MREDAQDEPYDRQRYKRLERWEVHVPNLYESCWEFTVYFDKYALSPFSVGGPPRRARAGSVRSKVHAVQYMELRGDEPLSLRAWMGRYIWAQAPRRFFPPIMVRTDSRPGSLCGGCMKFHCSACAVGFAFRRGLPAR